MQAPQQTLAAAALTRPRKETRLLAIAAILRNRALTRRRRLAELIPLPTVLIPLLAAAMALEAVGLLVAAVAERRVEAAEAAERHMVVEAAVRTPIARIRAFQKGKGPPVTNEAGLCVLPPKPIPSAQLSLRSRV